MPQRISTMFLLVWKRRSPGRPPKWVQQLLDADSDEHTKTPSCVSEEQNPSGEDDMSPPDEPQDTGDDSSEAELAHAADVAPIDRNQNRYSLRGRVSAPRRLMTVQSRSRSSLSEQGSDVAN